jgi:hypothetical protein
MTAAQTQMDLGLRLRDAGSGRVADRHAEWIEQARRVAHAVVDQRGRVSSDDLHELCPPPADAHPNIWGALFLRIGLVPVDYTKTRRPEGRGRVIRVYGRPSA